MFAGLAPDSRINLSKVVAEFLVFVNGLKTMSAADTVPWVGLVCWRWWSKGRRYYANIFGAAYVIACSFLHQKAMLFEVMCFCQDF